MPISAAAPQAGRKSLLKKVMVAAFLMFTVGAGIGILKLDGLLKVGLEQGIQQGLGVPAKVGGVELSVFGGELKLVDVEIDNPPGFERPHILRFSSADLKVDTASLFSDKIQIDHFELKDVLIAIERKGDQSNYEMIAGSSSQEKDSQPSPPEQTPQEEASGKSYFIGRILLTDIEVYYLVDGKDLKLRIPEILIEKLDSDQDQEMTLVQLNDVLMNAVFQAMLENPELLPNWASSELQSLLKPEAMLGFAKKLAVLPVDVIQGVGEGAKILGEGAKLLGDGLQIGGKEIKGALQKTEGVVDGIFGGSSKSKPKPGSDQ